MPVAVQMHSHAQIAVYDGARPAVNNLTVADRIVFKYKEEFCVLAAPHRVATTTHRFILSDEEDYKIPMRVVESSGEYFSGPRGKLLVIKKQR